MLKPRQDAPGAAGEAVGFTDREGSLHADAVPLAELAEKHGTPLYVYSASAMRGKTAQLQRAFAAALPANRQPLITFACKANSNVAVLRLLAGQGLGADIVSGGEMARALKAGIAPGKIVFSGVGKSDADILAALEHGILQINVESEAELARIAALAAKARKTAPVAFRFNPDVEAGTHAKITTGKGENKFGMPRATVERLYRAFAGHEWVKPRGLSMHIGSQLTTLEPFRLAFEKMADLARSLMADGLPLGTLDIGGGLGVVYRQDTQTPPDLDGYAALVRDIIAPLGTQIILEPGRLLVAEAGVLVSRVLYVKKGEGRDYLILDAGMNDLMRPALYDSWHTIRPVEQTDGRAMHTYDIVGPVCETGDTFAKDRAMPEMKEGELAVLMTGGAYGFVMASQYNTRPLPAEVLADGTRSAVIRARETLEEIIAKDIVPDWMTTKE